MEVKVTNDNMNKLLGRREIEVMATFDGKTPTKDELKENVCKKMNIDPSLSEVMKISQEYGIKTCKASIYAYNDKQTMEKNMRKVKEKKAKAPTSGAKAEAPKEEKK